MEAIARHAPECPKPVAKEVVPRFTKIINLHTFSRKSGAPASRMFEIYAYLRLNQTILFDKGRYLYFHAITSMTWQPSLQERLHCEQQNEKKTTTPLNSPSPQIRITRTFGKTNGSKLNLVSLS